MDTSIGALMGLLRETLADPRATARRLISLQLPIEARWMAFALATLASVIVLQGLGMVATGSTEMPSPMLFVLLLASANLVGVVAIHQVGRLMGGLGSFEDTLLLVAWLQSIQVMLILLQSIAFLVLPPLGGIVQIVGLVVLLWLLTSFVAELHGFRSLWAVFGMIVVVSLGLSFVLLAVLAGLGLAPTGD